MCEFPGRKASTAGSRPRAGLVPVKWNLEEIGNTLIKVVDSGWMLSYKTKL